MRPSACGHGGAPYRCGTATRANAVVRAVETGAEIPRSGPGDAPQRRMGHPWPVATNRRNRRRNKNLSLPALFQPGCFLPIVRKNAGRGKWAWLSGRTRRMDFTSGSGIGQQVVDGKRIRQNRKMCPECQRGKLGCSPRSRRNFFSQSRSRSATKFSMILICGRASLGNILPPVRRPFDIRPAIALTL